MNGVDAGEPAQRLPRRVGGGHGRGPRAPRAETPRSSRSSSRRRTASRSASASRSSTPSGGKARAARASASTATPAAPGRRSSPQHLFDGAVGGRATRSIIFAATSTATTPTRRRQRRRRRALADFPTAEVAVAAASTRDAIERPARSDRLPALRAAGDERRDLAVRHRQQPVPVDPRAHARVRAAARRRRDTRRRSGGWSATRASSRRSSAACSARRSACCSRWLTTLLARRPRPRLRRCRSRQLVVFLVLAVLVGVVAAVVPARRGARMQVLEALKAE